MLMRSDRNSTTEFSGNICKRKCKKKKTQRASPSQIKVLFFWTKNEK